MKLENLYPVNQIYKCRQMLLLILINSYVNWYEHSLIYHATLIKYNIHKKAILFIHVAHFSS